MVSNHRFRPYSHEVYSLVEVTDIKQPAVGTVSTYGESVIKEKDTHWRSLIQFCSWSGRASFLLKIYLFIYLFLAVLGLRCCRRAFSSYGELELLFVAAGGLSLVMVNWSYSSLPCTGFSLRWLLLLRRTGSRHMGFSGCGSHSRAQAQ